MGYRLMHAGLLRDTDGHLDPAPHWTAAGTATPAALVPSRYGEGRGPSWSCLAAIFVAHMLLLWALIAFDVIQVRAKPKPLVVTLLPEKVAPPENAPPPKPEVRPVTPPIVAPPPIVVAPAVSSPPVAVSPQPSPPAPPAPATPVAPVASVGEAPVMPPSPLADRGVNASPRYPLEARRKRWEGVVRLRVLVAIDGSVKSIGIARSSGHDVLDEEALRVVARWKFQPAMRQGEAVEAVGFVPIPFVLRV